MPSFSPKAGPLAYQFSYVLLSLLGLVFVVLGFLEASDLIRGKKHGIAILDSICWTMLFLSAGCGFSFHGLFKVVSISKNEANKKNFFNQPWYFSGDYSGFTAVQNTFRPTIYAFLTIPGMLGLTGLLCSQWYYSPSVEWVVKIFAVVLVLATIVVTLVNSMMIYNFAKHGGIELELSQMPLVPGSSFVVAAKVSQGFSPEYKAVIELKCHNTYRRPCTKYATNTVSVARVELPLASAARVNGRYDLRAEMKIPDDASPEDSSNADNQYHWEFCFNIEFDYDLTVAAPIYKVKKPSEIRFNKRLQSFLTASGSKSPA
ncbi:MAG: hypothetical protein KKB51_04350 [Candidatus Riflebacteria bacterium]|nr:hypothetical protein [Candidatus Riflebacteria bacterium]